MFKEYSDILTVSQAAKALGLGRTTANIYGHLDTSRKQSLADKLTECLREGR